MKARWKEPAAALLLGFLLGTAFGMWRASEHDHRRHRGGRQERYARMLEDFDRGLSLSPVQKEQVRAVLAAKRQKMKSLRDKNRPEVDEMRRSTRTELRSLLTPDQQVRFDALHEDMKRRREERRRR